MENKEVVNPDHYTRGFEIKTVSCDDVVRFLPFGMANPIKYIWRAGKKGDKRYALKDIAKARYSLERWIDATRFVSFRQFHDNTNAAINLMNMVSLSHDNDYEIHRLAAIMRILTGEYNSVFRCLDFMEEYLERGN